jgi:hypothetical protein
MALSYEVLEGFVQRTNEHGFQLVEKWLNYGDRWSGRILEPGEHVKVRVRGRYVVHVVNHDQELPPEPQPRRTGGGGRSPEEERRAIRQALIQSAVDFLRDRPEVADQPMEERAKGAHVLKLAEAFEKWVFRAE